MFEINLFNGAQILDQMIDFVARLSCASLRRSKMSFCVSSFRRSESAAREMPRLARISLN